MKTERIHSAILTPQKTGYAALGCMGLTVVSGFSKNKIIKKAHKPFSILTVLFTALHIGILEYYNYKFKAKR